MAKRKKKKKLYNKKQFKNIFCNKCKLCNGKPTFCYTEVYRKYPKVFTKDVFERLLDVKDWYKNRKRDTLCAEEFRYAFCMVLMLLCNPHINLDEHEARFTLCHRFQSCYNKFSEQQISKRNKIDSVRINRKKIRYKKNNRYICEPYPTVIMSDNVEWKDFIKGLFNNGDNAGEQNTTEEAAYRYKRAYN